MTMAVESGRCTDGIVEFTAAVGAAPPGWDDTVGALGGSVFHSTHWGNYQRVSRGAVPIYFLGRDAGGVACAAALGLRWASRGPILSRIFRDLELYAHPCARGGAPALVADCVARCETFARHDGCRQLTLSSVMSGESPFVPAEHGYRPSERIELVADLREPLDSLWRSIRKDQRERIRRLDREGVVITRGTTRVALDALRAVRESTQAKRVGLGQEYDLPAEPRFYDHLFTYLVAPGAAQLFVASKADEPIAAILFLTFNGRACSVFSGSSPAGYKLGAQGGLFWAAAGSFHAAGFRELNRGGVPASAAAETDPLHGIYAFKLRLGTTPQVCRSGEKVLSAARDRVFRLRERLRHIGGSGED